MIFIKFNGRDDNIGDKLIFSCLYAELKRYDDVYVFGSSPNDFGQKALRFREALAKAVVCKFRGRGAFVFHPPGARFLPKEPRKPKLKDRVKGKLILLIWSLAGAKLHITGISLGEQFDAGHYKRFETIGVRDKRSAELLSGIVKNVNLCPDMAFLRLPARKMSGDDMVFVSLREETPDDSYDPNYQLALKVALSSALTPFFDREWGASFFSNVIEDRNFNIDLSNEYASRYDVNYVDKMPVDLDYKSFFEGYGAVVSNRLHVLIPAMSEGLLPVALVSRTHSKIINLFCSYGLDQFLIYTDESTDRITARVTDLLDRQESLLSENYVKLCQLKSEVENYIASIVGQRR
jgi:polysaccharide pyruvyl transferase WcaK-like protein